MVFCYSRPDKRTHWENLGKRCLNEAEAKTKKSWGSFSAWAGKSLWNGTRDSGLYFFKKMRSTSLAVQWCRTGCPCWGQFRSLVWDDPVWRGVTKPERHHCWRPRTLEPVLSNKRKAARSSEEPVPRKMDKIFEKWIRFNEDEGRFF